MTERQQTVLESIGVDWQEALSRFMNNESLMIKFLLRFPQEPSYGELCLAMEEKKTKEAYEAAHSLKGVTGNLAIKPLYREVCALVEDLRGEDLDSAAKKMPQVTALYREVVAGLLSLE